MSIDNTSELMMSDLDSVRVPPHSVGAEQSVLGGIMMDSGSDQQALLSARGLLTGDEFYRYDHRLIWRAICDCDDNNNPVDVVVISEYLQSIGKLADAGGLAYLATLSKDTPSSANVKAYADIVKEKFLLRSIISLSDKASEMAFNAGERKAKDVLADLEKMAFDLAERDLRGKKDFKSIREIHREYLTWADDNKDRNPNEILGLSTGFDEVDRITSGLVPSDLIIVAGRPSMGKTTFAMNIVESITRTNKAVKGKPVIVFSLEMSDRALGQRLLAQVGGVDFNAVKMPWTAKEQDWTGITKGVMGSKDNPLYVNDTEGLTVSQMRNLARRLVRKIAKDYPDGLGAIVIDYLQLMGGSGSSSSTRNDEVSMITRGLKGMAKELNVPVIALSQLNRSLEKRMDKRPIMSDLRESGAIEQDADLIMFLYRDVVYDEQCPDPDRTEVIIAKARNGEIGTAIIQAQLKHSRFVNYQANYGGDYS